MLSFFFLSNFFFSEIHAYDNTAFNPGAHEMEERRDRDSKVEVERLGYEMYNGKHENRWAEIVMMYDMCSFFWLLQRENSPKISWLYSLRRKLTM